MSNVQAELHLAQLTDEELSTMGRAIATGLTGNLAFPNPVVSPTELVAAADDFDTKRKADVEAAAAASNATADMRHSRQVLHDTITRAAKKPETFHAVAQVTGSKVTLTEQPRGVALSFRIVALGAGGKESPPSAMVTIVV